MYDISRKENRVTIINNGSRRDLSFDEFIEEQKLVFNNEGITNLFNMFL